ncbi:MULTISPECIES: hypothetical protein [Nocardia]|uniref:Uncharacterized protein n=1 Tax=Nocardia arthritidis TaxID=228602 RepID=A0A6G9YTW2_9NOCA|nr:MULTISPECIES: hypothetical protein [Nocardia]QIS16769.1 hypothetical protein F5544_44830 [Nocardia arthritidis]
MYPCTNPLCDSGEHESATCPDLVPREEPRVRNLIIVATMALLIIAALVIAAAAAVHR